MTMLSESTSVTASTLSLVLISIGPERSSTTMARVAVFGMFLSCLPISSSGFSQFGGALPRRLARELAVFLRDDPPNMARIMGDFQNEQELRFVPPQFARRESFALLGPGI